MNAFRDENCEDSKENWLNVTLFLAHEERPELALATYRGVILHMVAKAKDLKAGEKISDWHFRFDSGNVAFRLRSEIEHKNEVLRVVEQTVGELAQKKLVTDHTLKEDRGWIEDDKTFKEKYKNRWRNWWWEIECDEILSELAWKVLSYQDFEQALNYAFHDLFNMFGWQSLNGVFAFQSGKSEEVADLLIPESAKEFKNAIEFRKNRFIERSIKIEIGKHRKASGSQKAIPTETHKEWEAKYRQMWDERALKAMFLY